MYYYRIQVSDLNVCMLNSNLLERATSNRRRTLLLFRYIESEFASVLQSNIGYFLIAQ
jgi:hypothetical protein